jgi:Protein of unknown function (DUF1015)
MAEQATLARLTEGRAGAELQRAPEVVEQRCCKQQVRAEPRVQLRRLAADRGDSDRVFEQAAGVRVVRLGRRQAAERRADRLVVEEPQHGCTQSRMRYLCREELEEALELVRIPAERRRQIGGVCVRRRFERAHVHLQAVAELLDTTKHAHRVAFREARVEQLDVVPHARVDSPARVDQLECKVRRTAFRPQPLLACNRVDAFDDTLFGELRDRAHALGSLTVVADVRPFRAERYDEAQAGPLERLVAPPYDVISAAEREDYLARSPYNVVHLTLPDDEQQAARDLGEWRSEHVLARDEDPGIWLLSQDYTGPDGVRRTRSGLVASLRAQPYEDRIVLPHERTHSGPKEGRLRLLRATGTQLEPIFLLYEDDPVEIPERDPDLQSGGDKLWRVADVPDFSDTQLLIADGHHRYETALAYAAEGGSPWLMVVLVPTRQEGLTIFPTHRVAAHVNGARGTPIEEPGDELPGVVLYRNGKYELLDGDELDVNVVERIAPQGVSYTPRREDAVATVDRGETMPQKSTYFFPKLTSGLLFHPLD